VPILRESMRATPEGYSYFFRQMISLCTLDVGCGEPGTEVIQPRAESEGVEVA
jgi:hypothetical protein